MINQSQQVLEQNLSLLAGKVIDSLEVVGIDVRQTQTHSHWGHEVAGLLNNVNRIGEGEKEEEIPRIVVVMGISDASKEDGGRYVERNRGAGLLHLEK